MEIDRIRRRVKLRDLDTLVAVMQAGTMHGAAKDLAMSQPAVSKAIAELETAVGVRLLERSRRGIAPTAYGAALTRRSEAVIDSVRSALRELAELVDPSAGEVHLGCMETLHAGLVGTTVHEFMDRYPRLRFTLESGQAADLVSHFLARRRVDFVVARLALGALPPEVVAESLFHDRLLVVCSPSHRLAKRRKLGAVDLHDERWVLGRNETYADSPVVDWFAAAGLSLPRRVVSSGSLQLRFNLLAHGDTLTCIPHSLLPFLGDTPRLRVLPVRLPPWGAPTMILTLRERALPPAADLFLARLRERSRMLSEP